MLFKTQEELEITPCNGQFSVKHFIIPFIMKEHRIQSLAHTGNVPGEAAAITALQWVPLGGTRGSSYDVMSRLCVVAS